MTPTIPKKYQGKGILEIVEIYSDYLKKYMYTPRYFSDEANKIKFGFSSSHAIRTYNGINIKILDKAEAACKLLGTLELEPSQLEKFLFSEDKKQP